MKKLFSLSSWLRRWRERRWERRMAEEFAFHTYQERSRLEKEGLSTEDALLEAERRFGDPRRVAELCRAEIRDFQATTEGGNSMSWLQDLRLSIRGLARQPTFLAIVVLTAAVGIGATTAVFSVVSSVLLNPLPYPEPQDLVRIYSAQEDLPDQHSYLTAPDLVDFRSQEAVFTSVGAFYDYNETGLDLTGSGPPQRLRALSVSAGYFDVLGATPLHGRLLQPEEERTKEGRYGAKVAVLSHHLWRSLSNGDPGQVGQGLRLDGETYTVVGVLKPGFLDVLQGEVDIWIPLRLDASNDSYHRDNFYLSSVARLAPGVSAAQAQDRLNAVLAVVEGAVSADERGVIAKLSNSASEAKASSFLRTPGIFAPSPLRPFTASLRAP